MLKNTEGKGVGVQEKIFSSPALETVLKPKRQWKRKGCIDYLRPVEAIFAREYVLNGGNGVQAYFKAKPGVAYGTAETQAVEFLGRPRVQAQIQGLIAASGVGLGELKQHVLWVIEQARHSNDLARVESAAMSFAKLSGLLVDKSESKVTHTQEQLDTLRRAVNDALKAEN